ncbi:MAG: RNA polymerase sigma factor region1.1 domain-containing protein, partial [Pseudomonadota bacterium]
MPVSKSVKSKQAPEAPAKPKTSTTSSAPAVKAGAGKAAAGPKSAASAAKAKKDTDVVTKSQAELKAMADELLAAATPKRGRKKAAEGDDAPAQTEKKPAAAKKAPAKAATSTAAAKTPAKRGRKPKAKEAGDDMDDADLSDIDGDIDGEVEGEVETEVEVEVEASSAPAEKVKPLRMKISKAKERALMKEFGLDETVLTEEEMSTRRQRLKALIKLGKTRGYLTHSEINDHLPDKLVDAETLEVVISMLNDMGVAVYEQTPDAETLLLNNTGQSATTEEEAEEEAEAALSTVDSEFGRTTDPVRMYMREMGT